MQVNRRGVAVRLTTQCEAGLSLRVSHMSYFQLFGHSPRVNFIHRCVYLGGQKHKTKFANKASSQARAFFFHLPCFTLDASCSAWLAQCSWVQRKTSPENILTFCAPVFTKICTTGVVALSATVRRESRDVAICGTDPQDFCCSQAKV